MALTDKVDDWFIYADVVLAAGIGIAAARYDFYLNSPTATPGYAAKMRLSVLGGGLGGNASGVPTPETSADWIQLDCLRPFSVWDIDKGPGTALIASVGAGVGFGGVLIDAFSGLGRPLFRNQLITGFSASAGASFVAGGGRWSYRMTTVSLAGAAA